MAFLGPWFIPMVVTAGGYLTGKLTEGLSIFPGAPDKPITPETTLVRIYAGMAASKNVSDFDNLNGNAPQVVLFDEFGDYIGDKKSDREIPEGGFYDIPVTPDKKGNNVRPTYLQINANGINALCISAIEVKYADGGSSTIFGDVPTKFYGFVGYASTSQFYLPGTEGQKELYRPWCMWIEENDGHDTDWEGGTWTANKHKSQSVNFHLPDFDGQPDVLAAYNQSRDLLCKSSARMQGHPWWPKTIAIFEPPLSYGNNVSDVPLVGDIPGVSHERNNLDRRIVVDDFVGQWPQSTEHKHFLTDCRKSGILDDTWWDEGWCSKNARRKRATRRSSAGSSQDLWALFDSLGDPSLSADYVCSQPNFIGPHYANAYERKFCRLDDRTVWPFCDDTHTTHCFDMDSHTLWGNMSAPANGSVGTLGVGSAAVLTPLLSLAGRSTLGL